MSLKVTPYQAQWIDQFQQAAAAIHQAIGEDGLRIDHIGSTAVPGLAAKPVIDIQVTVKDINVVPSLVARLAEVGFEHRPNAGKDRPPEWETQDPVEWNKEYFRTPTEVSPRTHVHFRAAGRRNQRYALLFRDYLRSNERARRSYGLYKQLLADAVGHLSRPGGTGPYLDLKDPILDLIADAAEKWAAEVGWQPAHGDA